MLGYVINTQISLDAFYRKLCKQVGRRQLWFTEGKEQQREEEGSVRAPQQAGSIAWNKLGLLGSSPVPEPLVFDYETNAERPANA